MALTGDFRRQPLQAKSCYLEGLTPKITTKSHFGVALEAFNSKNNGCNRYFCVERSNQWHLGSFWRVYNVAIKSDH